MKHLLKITLAVILLLTNFHLIVFAEEDPNAQCPNGIAAIVDSHIITMDDLQRKLAPFVRQLQKECTNMNQFQEKMAPLAQQILDRMIDDVLLVNSFKADKKLRVPESYLENNYTKFLVEKFQGNRSDYLEFLEAEGKTDRDLREQQREEVIIGFVRNRMRRSESTISPTQIKKYYEENKAKFVQKEEIHLRQIVLKNESKTEEEVAVAAPDKAQKIVDQLKKGRSFSEAAKEFTEDGMDKSGGDWGWISPADIRDELSKVAFTLKPKQFSDPIVLNNHTFILFVEDKKTPGFVPLEKVSEEIEKTLANNLAKQSEAQFVQKLRKKAHIKYCM